MSDLHLPDCASESTVAIKVQAGRREAGFLMSRMVGHEYNAPVARGRRPFLAGPSLCLGPSGHHLEDDRVSARQHFDIIGITTSDNCNHRDASLSCLLDDIMISLT